MFALKINFHQLKNFFRHFFVSQRKGHGIHSPFAYQLCEEVFYNVNSFYDFDELNKIRTHLLKNKVEIEIEDFGAGSKKLKKKSRKINDIAKKGISTAHQSEILYKLINFLNSKTCIELGTSLGLNTLYLAKVNSNATIITIEACEQLYLFASNLAFKNKFKNIQFIHSKFDVAFPKILNEIKELDFLYVDGNHTYQSTLNYFYMALLKKNDSTVIVFDDIYWNKEMTEAWKEIKNHSSVSLSIDTFYFGIIFFKSEIKEKIDLKLFL